MNLAQFSVKNSVLITFISIFLVLAGAIGVSSLNREAFPNIRMDIALIQTPYPGSTPQEVEKLITIPIERELKQVDHIDETISISADGFSVVTLKIDEDSPNPDRVINEIQRAVDRVHDLPDDLEDQPLVTEITTQNRPVVTVSLSGHLPESRLQELAKGLERQLLEIEGVAKIVRDGWREREYWVEVMPETMQDMHVGLMELIEALKKHNVSIPGGSLYQGKTEYILRTSGEFATVEDIGHVIVRANPSGQRILVKDVALVVDTFEERKIIDRTNGSRAINLTLVKKSSGDTINIVERARDIARTFQESDPNLTISLVNDMSYYIKRRLKVLVSNGWLGMILVVISVFSFLSLRVAIGACIGIPLAVLTTLALMSWIGISINLISMFGMIMVIGMLVDEEIVISENIYRHLEDKKSPFEAILQGASEVTPAVIATVATTMAAFVPLFMMSGTMGKFVPNIPIVVNLTLLASLTMALLVLPSHLYHLTRNDGHRKRFKPPWAERLFYRHLLSGYEKLLRKTIRHRYLTTTLLTMVLVACTLYAIYSMPFTLFPARGVDIFYIRAEGHPGDQLEVTEQKMRPLETLVSSLPPEELENFVTQVGVFREGGEDEFANRGTHIGQIQVFLTPEGSRHRDSEAIINALREKAVSVSGFKTVTFDRVRHGPPVGPAVQVRIRGDEFETIREIANGIKRQLKDMPGVIDMRDDSEELLDELKVQIDNQAAAQALLSVQDIATTVRAAFEGAVATTIKKTDEEINVVVRLPKKAQWRKENLENLLVSNPQGSLIPLKKVATVREDEGMRVIRHHDGIRAMSITADVEEKKTTSLKVNQKLEGHFSDIPSKYPGYTVHFGGEQEESQESLRSLQRALFIAAGLIFVILVAMFRSSLLPLVILISIPYSFIGVTLAFELHQMPLSFMALLGMVGLMGIVANNGILIVDFIHRERLKNSNMMETIIEGAKIRFRSIMLTSVTTILGVVPAAYGIGGLDPFIQPMALALNYGLLFGAVITVFLVPCLVAIIDDLHSSSRNLRMRCSKILTGIYKQNLGTSASVVSHK